MWNAGRKKKQQRKGVPYSTEPSSQPLSVGIVDPSTGVLLDTQRELNDDAWVSGRTLILGEARYPIVRNPPSIERLELYGEVFAGIPTAPRPALLFANEEACSWQWERRRSDSDAWEPIPGPAGTARVYTPSAEDVGAFLRVICRAGQSLGPGPRWGNSMEAIASGTVRARPEMACPWLPACNDVAEPKNQSIRVVTYNILADQYASTDHAKEVIFGHLESEFLAPTYRRPLILGQILGLQADIICLQEVDASAFELVLLPGLKSAYQGSFANKAGAVREGEALFFKEDRFTLQAHRNVQLRDVFVAAGEGAYGLEVADYLARFPVLRHALGKVGTIAQLALLVPKEEEGGTKGLPPILVINTHLFYHGDAAHIRTLHTWAIFQVGHSRGKNECCLNVVQDIAGMVGCGR